MGYEVQTPKSLKGKGEVEPNLVGRRPKLKAYPRVYMDGLIAKRLVGVKRSLSLKTSRSRTFAGRDAERAFTLGPNFFLTFVLLAPVTVSLSGFLVGQDKLLSLSSFFHACKGLAVLLLLEFNLRFAALKSIQVRRFRNPSPSGCNCSEVLDDLSILYSCHRSYIKHAC